jgi:hypothetical protein
VSGQNELPKKLLWVNMKKCRKGLAISAFLLYNVRYDARRSEIAAAYLDREDIAPRKH